VSSSWLKLGGWAKNHPLVKANKTWLRAAYQGYNELRFRHLLPRNAELKNRHLGETIYIFTTGRSVNLFDLSRFKGHNTFCCNNFFAHPQIKEANFTYYAHVEVPIKLQGAPQIPERSPIGYYRCIDKGFTETQTEMFFHYAAYPLLQGFEQIKNRPLHFVAPRPRLAGDPFDLDPSHKLNSMAGVIYFMMTLSAYMGFKRIYLIGAGWTLQPVEIGHFYDAPKDLEGLDHEAYARQPVEPLHYEFYPHLQSLGIEVFNLTPDGHQSPVYPSVTVEQVYKSLETI